MERIFHDTDKIILDQRVGPGIVPYLPLSELPKPSGTDAGGQ
jgi:hypothetical protein